MENKKRYIVVEGSVGVGKTTFTQMLAEFCPDFAVASEPAEHWLDVKGHGNLWELFHSDGRRWAFSTETFVSFVRVRDIERHMVLSRQDVLVAERSIYADRYCFALLAREQGLMSDLEWVMYTDWFDWLAARSPLPDGFIYLRSLPEMALARIAERGRPGEQEFSPQLAREFFKLNEDFFVTKKAIPASLGHVPVLIIDAAQDFKRDKSVQRHCVDQVLQFIDLLPEKA